jgi:peroxiredoxin
MGFLGMGRKQEIELYRRFWTWCFICFVLPGFFVLSGCGQKQPPAVGVAPPKFILQDLKGDKITVPDDFKGKAVIIRFWMDTCKACAKEMPEIDHIYNKYKDRGLAVLAVNAGQSREAAETFGNRLNITYPILLDPGSKITKHYGVKAVPFTFVINKEGIITKRILGETQSELFEKMIQDLL